MAGSDDVAEKLALAVESIDDPTSLRSDVVQRLVAVDHELRVQLAIVEKRDRFPERAQGVETLRVSVLVRRERT